MPNERETAMEFNELRPLQLAACIANRSLIPRNASVSATNTRTILVLGDVVTPLALAAGQIAVVDVLP